LAPITDILCEYLASGVVGPNIRGFRLKTYITARVETATQLGSAGAGSDNFGRKMLARINIEKWPDGGTIDSGGKGPHRRCLAIRDFEVWQLQGVSGVRTQIRTQNLAIRG